MIQLLIDNPLLLLFVVAAIGYPLGQIKVRGISLGVAAVLFVGLAFGALHPDLKLPEVIYSLGLVLFVYTVGLSSGPGFFASLRRKGLRYNLLVVGMICVGALASFAIGIALHLRPAVTAGMFAGSLTNTPALAGVVDYVKGIAPAVLLDQMVADPVIGYSITYPMGVIAMIFAIALMQRIWHVDYVVEAERLPDSAVPKRLHTRTIRVLKTDATRRPIRELIGEQNWDVLFARLRRGEELMVVGGGVTLQVGDLLSVVGSRDELERATAYLGEMCDQRLDFDRSEMDYRRMFVSNPLLADRRLKDLHLIREHGAVVTRVRRGDFEMLPDGEMALELGDQVRVLTHRTQLDKARAVFGDSYRALSEIDILTFSLGVALGLLLGSVPVPLPEGIVFRLGSAGGPLVAALILGTVGRTGPLVWSLPYSANLTLRQIGLVLFLAGIGTRSGYSFATTLTTGGGFFIFVAGAVITTLVAVGTLWIGHRMLKIPMGLLTGMVAGLQTQPAVLGFSLEQSHNELPNIGYAMVYPVAMIAKILLAQLILTLLLR
jgi:putative transport protein